MAIELGVGRSPKYKTYVTGFLHSQKKEIDYSVLTVKINLVCCKEEAIIEDSVLLGLPSLQQTKNMFPGAAGRRSMAEGSGKGEAEAPHAAFRQRVEHARQQIDRRHVHRNSSLSNVVAHSLADFDPTALRVFCVVHGLVHVMYGYTTWRNQWGQTTHLLG